MDQVYSTGQLRAQSLMIKIYFLSLINRLTLILGLLSGSSTAWCQVTITGIVISNDDKMPIPGVSVVEEATQNGTSTQSDGSFELTVTDKNSIIKFSFIGYIPQKVSLNGRDKVNIVLKIDCIRDWFDAQRIGLYLNSGVINNPLGGQFELSFPAYFGRGTLTTGISYQTNLEQNKFMTCEVELKHFIFNCNFDMAAGLFYRRVEFNNDFNSTAYSLETNFNFNGLGFITGYSHLNFERIETDDKHRYSGPLIGIRTWIKGPLRLAVSAKAAIYKNKEEYFVEVLRESRYIDAFVKFYKLDTFSEVTLGIGKTFGYRFRSQKIK